MMSFKVARKKKYKNIEFDVHRGVKNTQAAPGCEFTNSTKKALNRFPSRT